MKIAAPIPRQGTSITGRSRPFPCTYSVEAHQGDIGPVHPPIMTTHASTHVARQDDDIVLPTSISGVPGKSYAAPKPAICLITDGADAVVIQVWEGTVTSIDFQQMLMSARLAAKMGEVPEHTGEISLEWVAPQDMDLVAPGSVFYLTLFKRRKQGGTLENSQELRFRRRPAWSVQEVEQVNTMAESMLAKLQASPLSA